MDDLSSLDWNPKSGTNRPVQPSVPIINTTSVRLTPLPTHTQTILTPQPLSRPSSSLSVSKSPIKPISPGNDSFANLISSNNPKPQSNLTLQDRQKQLLAERQRQIAEQQKRQQEEAKLWDTLGSGNVSGSGTPALTAGNRGGQSGASKQDEGEDDILAAFNSAVKVDRSSHFPPPISTEVSEHTTPVTGGFGVANGGNGTIEDDDDPFGLGSMPRKPPTPSVEPSAQTTENNDDILGDLGRPITARPKTQAPSQSVQTSSTGGDPLDASMAELVDMGFPPDKARQALVETSGNIQGAVGWLLNQAHEESRQKSRASERPSRTQTPLENGSSRAARPAEGATPAWSRPASSAQRRQETTSPTGERDPSQQVQEFGTAFFKSANSLWKQGQKRMQKAVAEFQQPERDTSQPRWMRDPSADSRDEVSTQQKPSGSAVGHHGKAQNQESSSMTDEAMLLESGAARPQRSGTPSTVDPRRPPLEGPPSRGRSPAQALPERPASQQRSTQPPTSQSRTQAPSKLSRQAVDDEAAQAYVSSARRRKPPTQPKSEAAPEVDLFSPAPPSTTIDRPAQMPTQAQARTKPSTPAPPTRPQPASRTIPPVSPSALSTSAQHRKNGTEAFKRGDYAAAHDAYTAALTPLPQAHPITIIILSNRALTALKTGSPKLAVSDADAAISLIGPSRGEGESIDLGVGEGHKDMKEFYGKALLRKAEALEHMEKWRESGAVWREAVEAGVGGLVAVRGRDRCEKASNPSSATPTHKPAVSSTTRTPAASKPRPNKPNNVRPTVAHAASAEAVKKLRQANQEAERADEEKFQLADVVAARIEAWRGGKADNLRALLGSLDAVLWDEAGWKKVGMAELVLPGRVKVVYMKAIAKVHPDKIPQTATTEQRMVSGSVFSTLNEAWDKFKKDNGL